MTLRNIAVLVLVLSGCGGLGLPSGNTNTIPLGDWKLTKLTGNYVENHTCGTPAMITWEPDLSSSWNSMRTKNIDGTFEYFYAFKSGSDTFNLAGNAKGVDGKITGSGGSTTDGTTFSLDGTYMGNTLNAKWKATQNTSSGVCSTTATGEGTLEYTRQ